MNFDIVFGIFFLLHNVWIFYPFCLYNFYQTFGSFQCSFFSIYLELSISFELIWTYLEWMWWRIAIRSTVALIFETIVATFSKPERLALERFVMKSNLVGNCRYILNWVWHWYLCKKSIMNAIEWYSVIFSNIYWHSLTSSDMHWHPVPFSDIQWYSMTFSDIH